MSICLVHRHGHNVHPAKVHRSAKITPAGPVEKPSSATAGYGEAAAWPGRELERLGVRLAPGGVCLQEPNCQESKEG